MWLMVPGGFVSIVQKPSDRVNDTLTVRARDKVSLANFVSAAKDENFTDTLAGIKLDIATDYPFRAVLTREEVEIAVMVMTQEIVYSNFKNMAHDARPEKDDLYTSFLSSVWTAGLRLEPEEAAAELSKRWAKAKPSKAAKPKGKAGAALGVADLLEADLLEDQGAWKGVMAMNDDEWEQFMKDSGGI